MCVHLGEKGNIMVIVALVVCFLSFLVFLVCWAKPIYAEIDISDPSKFPDFGDLNEREKRDPLQK